MCQWTVPLYECGHSSLEDVTRAENCKYYTAYRNILANDGGVSNIERRLTELLKQCGKVGHDWFVFNEGLCLDCQDQAAQVVVDAEGVEEEEEMEDDDDEIEDEEVRRRMKRLNF